jgi:hypothetical protein
MTPDSLDLEMLCPGKLRQQRRQFIPAHAQPGHTGIDLEMDRNLALAQAFRCRIEPLQVPFSPDRRREVVFEDRLFFSLPESAEQQNASFDSALAQD